MYDSVTWDRIGRNVLDELDRRLGDPEEAERLPGAALLRIAEKYVSYLEKKEANMEPLNPDDFVTDPIIVIDIPEMPSERKIPILEDFIREEEVRLAYAKKRLIEIQAEVYGAASLHESQSS